ncbi:transglycosylase domain-containing protein [Bacillus marasmi]|uniref:transglycosylase domain-containing protein n=1 Tax=Bacillus marasmi TaxID=1926279 RepID=UPI0011CA5970|nr:transglycosylase domain-containing protein [Bacillus marasmi]
MNESQNWKEKLRSALQLFTNQKTVKGVRITYQVIWNLGLLFFIILMVGGTFALGVGGGYFASLVKDEPIRTYASMKKQIYNYEETSELYFANDVYLGKLRSDIDREEVKLDQVSQHLKDAVVATEDEYFYQHDGVVPKAIFRALFQEVSNASVQTGGSTLTQQLIKNQLLSNEVSFERKAKEILLALRLEKFFEKEEILEAYLNVATFGRNSSGRNIAGVQAAAKGIFGVEASQLSLPQAAFIAGLPQSPFGYTPYTQNKTIKNNLSPGLERMKTVLKRMFDGGYITQQQYDEALAYDITKDFIPPKESPSQQYPYLTTEIEKRSIEILAGILAQQDGYEEQDLKDDKELKAEYLEIANLNIRQNGYKIHTTVNKEIYDAMQQVKNNYPHFGPDKAQETTDPETGEKVTIMEPVEVGAILIENKTGKIISFVGGRDYQREQLNHATSAVRQNGSTMKPLLVYAPAFELGAAQPGTILPDVALKLAPGINRPWPQNYDRRYSGLTSARHALTKSYNVPAVKLYKDIIAQRPATYLEKMGFTSLVEPDYTNLATAIGSLENGVTVEENTNAFGTFANGGKFVDAYMIEKITDRDGNAIYQHEVKETEVFSPQTSYLTLDIMRDVITRGTATSINSRLKFKSDWAGKTGTGNQFYDAWFVATNPNVTFGIWTGYDTPKSLQTGGLSYSIRTNYLWADLMNAAYDINPDLVDPAESFQMPSGIVSRSFCAASGGLPSDACSKAGLVETDLFNIKYAPTKGDDSLISGKFVEIGGKKYVALDSTPAEFSESGVILNPDYVAKMMGTTNNAAQLIPKMDRWANVLVADAKINEDGNKPTPLNISLSGNNVSWGAHPHGDIVGYRVYQNGAGKVLSIKSGAALSFTGGTGGSYYVTAVDIAGNESGPSNTVTIGVPEQQTQTQTKSNPKKQENTIPDPMTNP